MAQRIETLSLYGSMWALSEESGFKSYPNRLEVYLVKNVCAIDNNNGREDSAFLSEVAVKKKKARGEIWLKRSEKNNKKNYQDEDKSPQ